MNNFVSDDDKKKKKKRESGAFGFSVPGKMRSYILTFFLLNKILICRKSNYDFLKCETSITLNFHFGFIDLFFHFSTMSSSLLIIAVFQEGAQSIVLFCTNNLTRRLSTNPLTTATKPLKIKSSY